LSGKPAASSEENHDVWHEGHTITLVSRLPGKQENES